MLSYSMEEEYLSKCKDCMCSCCTTPFDVCMNGRCDDKCPVEECKLFTGQGVLEK